jgi:adenosylcobinamide-GDP ribazoletransferase
MLVVAATPLLLLQITGIAYFWLLLTTILTFLVLRFMMMQRIHGMTGDTAGALIEMTETSVLLAAVLRVTIDL